MTGLERKAHRLVELAREGDEPTAAQLLSLHSAVAARVAAEGAIAAPGATAAFKAASAGAFVKGLVAAGAVAAGAVSFFALQGASAPVASPLSTAQSAAPAPTPIGRVAPGPEPVLPVAPTVAPATPNRPAKATPSLRLEDEAALLAQVQGALRRGQGSVALSKLESYDKRFPTGMLRSEADAARVFALCAAGRVDKARVAATRFVQRYPHAPATARVQSACK